MAHVQIIFHHNVTIKDIIRMVNVIVVLGIREVIVKSTPVMNMATIIIVMAVAVVIADIVDQIARRSYVTLTVR